MIVRLGLSSNHEKAIDSKIKLIQMKSYQLQILDLIGPPAAVIATFNQSPSVNMVGNTWKPHWLQK